jgi:hypothetical protein
MRLYAFFFSWSLKGIRASRASADQSTDGADPRARENSASRVAAVLVVPGICPDAEDPRIERLAACGKGSGVELVSPVRPEPGTHGIEVAIVGRPRTSSARPWVGAEMPKEPWEAGAFSEKARISLWKTMKQ